MSVNALLIDLLEDIHEAAIIALKNRVLRRHVQRPLLHDGVLEAGVGKVRNALYRRSELLQM